MNTEITPFQALERAIEVAGGQSALARICHCTQAAVWKWVKKGRPLPAEHVITVEAETGVSRHALRPDIYPHDAASLPPVQNGVVGCGAPIVACDRSAALHPENGDA